MNEIKQASDQKAKPLHFLVHSSLYRVKLRSQAAARSLVGFIDYCRGHFIHCLSSKDKTLARLEVKHETSSR